MQDDVQEQLALLRRRITRINQKYVRGEPRQRLGANPFLRRQQLKPARYCVEQWLAGEEVETPHGRHFESVRLWELHRRHGSMELSQLTELPADLFHAISEGAIAPADCRHWAFLDTETTGLAGGTGTYAFLVGVGRITREGFHLRQFFMREPCEEPSLLHALSEYLKDFEVLVTYNGRTYDEPLLETRYRLARAPSPFNRLSHMDLLFGARRLWNLRFDSCRLIDLERQILGFEREGDLPGEMIPYVYQDYLRTKEAFRVAPILHHNAYDILTLACLTAIVPQAFRTPAETHMLHGPELVGLGRWLYKSGRQEEAASLFRRALDRGLPDGLLFRTMWDLARIEKKAGRCQQALALLEELSGCPNPYRVSACEELAKFFEHEARDLFRALHLVRQALEHADTDGLRRRRQRLERKLQQSAGDLML